MFTIPWYSQYFDSIQYMEGFNRETRITRINDVFSKISVQKDLSDRADM